MARERTLSGIVRPSVDEQAVERNVARPLSDALDRASQLAPDLDLRGARRQVKRLGSSLGGLGGALSTAGGAAAGGSLGADDVQEKQLSELTDIRRTLEKDALSGEGGGGGIGGGIGGGLLAGIGSALGSGSLLGGLGTAAGIGLAGLGPISAFIGAISANAENGPQTDPGAPDPRADTGESARDTGRMDSNPLVNVPKLSTIRKKFQSSMDLVRKRFNELDWPPLPNLSTLVDWPDLPKLSQLVDWPSYPNLSTLVDWPDYPKLSQLVDWPKEPAWVKQLTSTVDTLTGGGRGQGSERGRDGRALEGGDVRLRNRANPNGNPQLFGISEQEVQQEFEQMGDSIQRGLESAIRSFDLERAVEQIMLNKLAGQNGSVNIRR